MKIIILVFGFCFLFNSCFAQKQSKKIEYLIEIIDSIKQYEDEIEKQNVFHSPVDKAIIFQKKIFQFESFNIDSLENCIPEISSLLINDASSTLDVISKDILIRICFNIKIYNYTMLIDSIVSSGSNYKEILLSKLIFTQGGHYTNKIVENWSNTSVQSALKKIIESGSVSPHKYSPNFLRQIDEIYKGKAFQNKEDDWVYIVDDGYIS